LELAIIASAKFLITRDNYLLTLTKTELHANKIKTKILTPEDFLKIVS
jgi:predicted nucleic acid-binding protein